MALCSALENTKKQSSTTLEIPNEERNRGAPEDVKASHPISRNDASPTKPACLGVPA